MKCKKCGCTDADCSGCVERTGRPCVWVEHDVERGSLCSACTPRFEVLGLVVVRDHERRAFADSWVYVIAGNGFEPQVWTGPPNHMVPGLTELHLPPDLWAIARRVLPRLAKRGRLVL